MNKNILITLKKEIRAILREKKSLIIMLLTPFIIPFYFIVFSYIFNGMMSEVDNSYTDTNHSLKYEVGINYNLNETEEQIINNLNLNMLKYETEEELKKAYQDEEIVAYIIYEDKNYTIYVNDMDDESTIAGNLIESYLSTYNDYLANLYLESIDADKDRIYHNVNYKYVSLEGSNMMMNTLISIGFTFAVMSICLTAIYTTTDTMAGEKERGTLETFLTFPIKSHEIITGKYLAISTSCIITSMIDIFLIVLSLLVSYKSFNVYENAILNVNGLSILIAFIILVSFSLFISGLCIAISSKSKTYKEAQSSLTPISLITIIPMFLTTAGVKLNLGMSFIPIVNHTYLLQDLLLGKYNILYLIITFITTIIYTILIILVISRIYKKEDTLFQN